MQELASITEVGHAHQVQVTLLTQHLDEEVVQLLGSESISNICRAYDEYWRYLHNLGHPIGMLRKAKEFRDDLSSDEWITLQLMIIYHDYHNKPGLTRYINEQISAQQAQEDIKDKVALETYYCVGWGILATADHNLRGIIESNRPVVGLLIDLDLMGLGGSSEDFRLDTNNVWLEYQPVCTKEQFDAGRADWARSFLKRKNIFLTEQFDHLEEQARKNLQALVK